MREWWNSREVNERRLMMIAAALIGVIVIAQFIVSPLRASRVDAQLSYEASVRSLSVVRAELGSVKTASEASDKPAINADTLRSAATGLALERGLKVNRIQTRADSVVSVSLENADARLVFAWLQDVRAQLGADISRASISQGPDGTIQAIIDLRGAD